MKQKLIKQNTNLAILKGILCEEGIPPILDGENETSIEVIEGIRYGYGPPNGPGKNQTREKKDYKYKKLYTLLFTNGEIIYTGKKDTYSVKDLLGFKIKDKQLTTKLMKFYNVIDTINIYHIKVINADYVVKVLVGEESLIGGLYHVIQDKEVYLKNKSDKDTTKHVKEILKMLREKDIRLCPKIDFEKMKNDKKTKTIVKVRKIK